MYATSVIDAGGAKRQRRIQRVHSALMRRKPYPTRHADGSVPQPSAAVALDPDAFLEH